MLVYYKFGIGWLIFASLIFIGCDRAVDPSARRQSPDNFQKISTGESNPTSTFSPAKLIKVDVETASLSYLSEQKQYKGTTQPQKQVSWRSQTEGTLLELSVEVGDRVSRGQIIGKLDDRILQTDVAGKTGELIALESELAQAGIQVKNAQIKLEETEIQLQQAKSEALRYQDLAKTGLIAQQQAESFKTAAKIAEKALLTAREAVKLEEQAVEIVRGRITTQRSAIAESKQRQAYSQIIAPIDGIAIAVPKDPGSLVRPGEEVITIGDFSQIKIVVPLSELDLGQVNVGQRVKVKLDAFADRQFFGKINRISPTTNPLSRQIPLEILIDNPNNLLKGGLLARVNFASTTESHVIVPERAIISEGDLNYIFTVAKHNGDKTSKVTKRRVTTGERANGKVEIIAGISPGERYVLRSSQPLKDRDLVGLSILSQ
ncbi:efflux RND transporter periplasmic adaptor subunit [Waterburya agarophytonicola K14]|uniref:Efflux RND transporter periplasmic adaptor subunit n=1 Tax=Waterburya agarophytonicola KI4 TaxID=2874699 RepID=A0A964BS23_9CYAN|nr:efflux RND transporter periplasmic adaptor subunit [Waterburya agarophytonicola]MCC0178119.1 efflux RND transporter periplasmic adaptor subunit [Waterburya agarophytonicola KI4]